MIFFNLIKFTQLTNPMTFNQIYFDPKYFKYQQNNLLYYLASPKFFLKIIDLLNYLTLNPKLTYTFINTKLNS